MPDAPVSDDRRAEPIRRREAASTVTLCDEHIRAAMSRNGGWSAPQFKLLGKWFSGATIAEFIRLRDSHL